MAVIAERVRKISVRMITMLLFLCSFSMAAAAAPEEDIYSKLYTVNFVGGNGPDTYYVHEENALVQDSVVYRYYPETDSFTAVVFYKDAGNLDVVFPSRIYGKKVKYAVPSMFDYEIYMVACKSVTFPNTMTESISLTESRIGAIRYSDNMKDPGMVREDNCLREVTLPKKAVKSGSFIGCSNLRRVSMGEQVKTVESFRDCESLARLQLPASVTAIQADAFKGCTSLTLYVPASVKKVGKNAFGSKKSNQIRMLYCVKDSAAYKEARRAGIPYTLIKPEGKSTGLREISVPDDKLTLLKDESVYLNARAVPIYAEEQEFVYSSSDPEAVTVDPYGKVTTLKYDSDAVITIQSAADKRIKKKVKVRVKKKGSESFLLRVNGATYAADLNDPEVRGNRPLRLEEMAGFRIYEASTLKKSDNPYGQAKWKLVRETKKDKLSIRAKEKKYYLVELKYRRHNGWYYLCTTGKM